jgi:hypothetical protein
MDKINSIIEELKLPKPSGTKTYEKRKNGMEKILLKTPKHIDYLIDEIKKDKEDNRLGSIATLYNQVILEQNCEDRYIVEIIILMVWGQSELNLTDDDEQKQIYNFMNEETGQFNHIGVKDCYDLIIKKVFDKYYPKQLKDNSGNNNVIIYDMRVKEAKFDYVYENIFSACDKSVIKNKYQHKSQLKKKFLKGNETYDNGKIDYQLVMFNRLFDLEMRQCPT